MKVITLAKAKDLLGANAPSDAAITKYIPIIDAKVKKITKQRYNDQLIGITKAGSKYVELISITCEAYGYYRFDGSCGSGINNPWTEETLQEYLEIGTLVSGDGIPADAYIDEAYYNGFSATLGGSAKAVPVIELSEAAAEDNNAAQIFFGFNVGLQDTVAQGIKWLNDQESKATPENATISESYGPVSKSYDASVGVLDRRYGMPSWFVKAFQGERHMSGY